MRRPRPFLFEDNEEWLSDPPAGWGTSLLKPVAGVAPHKTSWCSGPLWVLVVLHDTSKDAFTLQEEQKKSLFLFPIWVQNI